MSLHITVCSHLFIRFRTRKYAFWILFKTIFFLTILVVFYFNQLIIFKKRNSRACTPVQYLFKKMPLRKLAKSQENRGIKAVSFILEYFIELYMSLSVYIHWMSLIYGFHLFLLFLLFITFYFLQISRFQINIKLK